MGKRSLICVAVMLALQFLQAPAEAGEVTWRVDTPKDTFNRSDLNSSYDIENVTVAIWDNAPDELWFYLHFAEVPSVTMFNDGRGSWASIFLDSNLDGKDDYEVSIAQTTMNSTSVAVQGELFDLKSTTMLSCNVNVWNNISSTGTATRTVSYSSTQAKYGLVADKKNNIIKFTPAVDIYTKATADYKAKLKATVKDATKAEQYYNQFDTTLKSRLEKAIEDSGRSPFVDFTLKKAGK
jgi:hypothetical protein